MHDRCLEAWASLKQKNQNINTNVNTEVHPHSALQLAAGHPLRHRICTADDAHVAAGAVSRRRAVRSVAVLVLGQLGQQPGAWDPGGTAVELGGHELCFAFDSVACGLGGRAVELCGHELGFELGQGHRAGARGLDGRAAVFL